MTRAVEGGPMSRSLRSLLLALAASLAGCAELQQAIDEVEAADAAEESAARESRPAPAAPQRSADGRAFAGVFHFVGGDGTVSVVKLAVRGAKVAGTLDAVAVDASVVGDGAASGRLVAAGTDIVVGEVSMSVDGDSLFVGVQTIDPRSGERGEPFEIEYVRGAPPVRAAAAPKRAESRPAPSAPGPARGSAPAPSADLYADLVGRWRHSWQIVDRYASVAGEVWAVFESDGTFAYGAGRAFGGDGNTSVESSGWNPKRGRWRSSKGETIQVAWDDEGVWFEWATCLWVNGTLQLTYRDGDKQRFYRQ
jgi:hypothetical protein